MTRLLRFPRENEELSYGMADASRAAVAKSRIPMGSCARSRYAARMLPASLWGLGLLAADGPHRRGKDRHHMAMSVWVCQAGRDMLLSHFALPFESGWFCRLLTPAPGQCCDPRLVSMPPHVSPTSCILPAAPIAPSPPHHACTL